MPALCIVLTQPATVCGSVGVPSMHYHAECGWKMGEHTVSSATKQFDGCKPLSAEQQSSKADWDAVLLKELP